MSEKAAQAVRSGQKLNGSFAAHIRVSQAAHRVLAAHVTAGFAAIENKRDYDCLTITPVGDPCAADQTGPMVSAA